jgi:hypothetical protein
VKDRGKIESRKIEDTHFSVSRNGKDRGHPFFCQPEWLEFEEERGER